MNKNRTWYGRVFGYGPIAALMATSFASSMGFAETPSISAPTPTPTALPPSNASPVVPVPSSVQAPSVSAVQKTDGGASALPPPDFNDARPDKERKTYSVNRWNQYACEFGVQDLGDEFVDRVGQLRHDLIMAYGDKLSGKKITVDHYHLYLNEHAMISAHYWSSAFLGVMAMGAGANAKTTAPGCAREKMKGGWFDPAELTTPWSPFIADIEVHIDGQPYLVHSVYSPPKNMPAPGILTDFDVKSEQVAVHVAVDKANSAMVAEVGKQLGVVQGAATPPMNATVP